MKHYKTFSNTAYIYIYIKFNYIHIYKKSLVKAFFNNISKAVYTKSIRKICLDLSTKDNTYTTINGPFRYVKLTVENRYSAGSTYNC